MPTEIARPSAPIESARTQQAAPAGINSPEATALGLTPLAIAAILALVLHVASGVMLDSSHAGAIGAVQDDCATCPVEASPPQPALPYD